jgi:photosystem II stability/assembly factor-like uncharacterized protein
MAKLRACGLFTFVPTQSQKGNSLERLSNHERQRASLLLVLILSVLAVGCGSAPQPLETGWVISSDSPAVILHTADGGQHWSAQGNSALWAGYSGNDISAVDDNTAWAARGGALGAAKGGKILHTNNGGAEWSEQPLPEGMGLIKNIKGLSRNVAWAVSLDGTVLRTTTGGNIWTIVPHPSVPIHQVNRMDALGIPSADVWIADDQGKHLGMIHTPDNGVTWRQEYVPYEIRTPGVHMVSGYSSMVAWAAVWGNGDLFRTLDGGETWEKVATVGGLNDLDDMCAVSADTVWVVQNHSGESGGTIFHVRLQDGQSVVDSFNPASNYTYEGLACADDQEVAVVGFRSVGSDPSLPAGVIVSTKDGGQTWFNQPVPVNDAHFWKVSFVGARR